MYQALYRKYRPQTFDDVVGQRGVTDTLRAQTEAGRLSHAYLFTGTRGTGKTSCARILAKAVNCLDLQGGNPCNRCANCRAIDSGACVDVQEIDAASNTGVDNVRTLRDEAVYTPAQVKKRIYIIDEVHMLSISAFNALLKLIEEPPEHLMFILATTELQKVPATILSRCQRFSFRRIRTEDIAERLQFIAYREKIELDGDAAILLARLADGGLRDGISLLDQCASAASGAVTRDTVCAVLGLAGEENTEALFEAIAEKDVNAALTLFFELYAAGRDLAAMLGELSALARDLLVLKTAPQLAPSSAIDPQRRAALSEACSPAELLYIVSRIQQTLQGFAVSANRRLDTELCLMELCQPELLLDPQALSARIGRLEEQGVAPAPKPKKAEKPKPAEPKQEAPKPEEKPKAEAPKSEGAELPADFWAEFLAKIRSAVSPAVHGMLAAKTAVPLLKEDRLLLIDRSGILKNVAGKDEPLLAQLSQTASALLGRSVRVQITDSDKPAHIGEDPMRQLLSFGSEHSDIIQIQ